MSPEQADEELARRLRYEARIEHVRRYTIEQCALVAERACSQSGGPVERDKRVMAIANSIRALAAPEKRSKE